MLGQFASTMGCAYLTALHLAAMMAPHSGHTTKQDNFLVYSGKPSTLKVPLARWELQCWNCPWCRCHVKPGPPHTVSIAMRDPDVSG